MWYNWDEDKSVRFRFLLLALGLVLKRRWVVQLRCWVSEVLVFNRRDTGVDCEVYKFWCCTLYRRASARLCELGGLFQVAKNSVFHSSRRNVISRFFFQARCKVAALGSVLAEGSFASFRVGWAWSLVSYPPVKNTKTYFRLYCTCAAISAAARLVTVDAVCLLVPVGSS